MEDHMATVPAARVREKEYSPPPVNADFYKIAGLLDPKERAVVKRVRDFMETEVAPIIEDYWGRDQFPHEIIPKLRALDVNIAGVGYRGYGAVAGCSTASSLWRWHASTRPSQPSGGFTLRRGAETALAATDDALGEIGCFGLTEPLVGSATSGGMLTTCRREGETWILNGQKKWIGNSTFSDINVLWARDEGSGEVKGF